MEAAAERERRIEGGFNDIHEAWARCFHLAQASESNRLDRRWLFGVRRQRLSEDRFDWVIVAVPRAE